MKLTEEVIAREAGVSPASVSRFFDPTGQERLKPETRAKIQPVVKKYEYVPSERIVLTRKYKTGAFGILVPLSTDLFESPYHRKVLSGVIESVEKSQYDVRLIPVRDEAYLHMRGFLRKHLVDGLIVLTWRSHPNLIGLLKSRSKPFPIFLINDFDEDVPANFVYCDVAEGMKRAVQYLAEEGKKRIAFLKGPTFNRIGSGEHTAHVESLDSKQKLEGFQQAMKAFGFELKDAWIGECHAYTKDQGYGKTEAILTGSDKPEALICSNDALAQGALDYLRDHKIHCPGELSVIGFDGYDESESTDPPLTTVRQPMKEMGKKTCDQLIEIAEGRCFTSGSLRFRFSPELVIRKSA